MSDILITGTTGNVGSAVTNALSHKGIVVRAGVRNPAAYPKNESVIPVRFDFAEPRTYKNALAGVRKVFLMRPPAIANVKTVINPFVDFAIEAGVEHIVFLSLLGVEHNRFVPHRAIEDHIVSRGISHTFLRAGFFMQNLDTTHRADIVERDELFMPAGKGKTSFIDVRDLGAVGALALVESGHEKKAYALTGDAALDYFEAARIFSEVLGREIRYANPSPWEFVRRWRKRDAPWGQVLVMTGIYTVTRVGKSATITTEVQRLLGRPAISFRQYVEDYRDCWSRSTT
jgi:uncharacterized protein YbjT (DUF2867 family)